MDGIIKGPEAAGSRHPNHKIGLGSEDCCLIGCCKAVLISPQCQSFSKFGSYSKYISLSSTFMSMNFTVIFCYGHAGVLDDLVLCGFRCAFSCMFQYSLYHGMDIGTCDIVHWSAAPHDRIANRTGLWVYAVLVLNVIRYSCHYFLDRIIFHHGFHRKNIFRLPNPKQWLTIHTSDLMMIIR